jgi:pimeloyl-ACP methyl ester carboxylesterase
MTPGPVAVCAGMRLVPVNDVELCVDEYGDPADPPVVLVYGAAGSMDWWDVGLCILAL